MITQTFEPAILQKLLGKNYKWWYVIKTGFKSNTNYRLNSISWLLSSVVLILGTVTVWYINYSGKTGFDENFSNIFTYLIIGEAAIFSTSIQFDIGENIQDGKLVSRLLRPTSVFKYYIFHSTGYQFFENISKLIIYSFIGILFYKYLIIPNFINLLWFITTLFIVYTINIFIGISVGLSAFFLTAFFGSAALFDNIKLVFSGKFFPLNALSLFKFSLFLPFSFTFYHPMQIYLGKYNTNEIIYVFLGGLAWCVFLYFLAKVIFKAGLKRNESVGL